MLVLVRDAIARADLGQRRDTTLDRVAFQSRQLALLADPGRTRRV
jgi:hypothetical protein